MTGHSQGNSSALYTGQVMHRRLRPRKHRLRYRIFSLLLDLDEIDAEAARLRLFSRGAFNLFSFYDRDHGDGSGASLRAQVETHLAQAGISAGGAIRLLAMPRILGFGFNPISVYFCHRPGGALAAILYEVHNTFGERHSYLFPVGQAGAEGPGADGILRHGCAKAFHVSPFMGMDMDYAFRVMPPGERLSIAITGGDAAGPIITALHTAERQPLTDGALGRIFITHPLLTAKVVGGIVWEAAKLWIKRVPVFDHPAPPRHAVTFGAAQPAGIVLPAANGEIACI